MMATPSPKITEPDRTSDALLIFCRAPRLGVVKTRLAATLGAALALRLYSAMLRDCFDLGRALTPHINPIACFTPDDAFDDDSQLSELWNGARLPQRGDALGARMLNALADVRARGFERAVIIGSDAPDLPLSHLRHAFELLRQNDVVVGPSRDGGFVLIGAARPVDEAIFAGITWSRDDVCARLLSNLSAQGLGYALLEERQDVDEIADLMALRQRLQNADSRVARATREVLADLRDLSARTEA